MAVLVAGLGVTGAEGERVGASIRLAPYFMEGARPKSSPPPFRLYWAPFEPFFISNQP